MNIQGYEKLPTSFYLNADVVAISQSLLGVYLFSCFDGILTGGRIVETEAYKGGFDLASHATKGKTKRTEVVFRAGGCAYVYLCYGIHHLLNVVTNESEKPDCALIRAIEPVIGVPEMMLRRNKSKQERLTAGPGTVTQALGITTKQNGVDLTGDQIWLAKSIVEIPFEMETSTRIGVGYPGADALLPWRFSIKRSAFVSVAVK